MAQMSLHNCTGSLEPFVFARKKYGSRKRVKERHIATVNVNLTLFHAL